jgi:hypothetical protein
MPYDCYQLTALLQATRRRYLLLLTNAVELSSITGLTVGQVLEQLSKLHPDDIPAKVVCDSFIPRQE